jgi:polygalacturonase
LARG